MSVCVCVCASACAHMCLCLLLRVYNKQMKHFTHDLSLSSRSYYESSELPSAIGVMEEALKRHPELVTHECINMAAELYIANHEHTKALQVR